ncbi:multidrug resistance [Metschnikowia bicuspidata var. bicuspidata NRRL YB-4993]|uniref:Multidrug resistance n=1 Tax=Metschnikowia bicuspidata var. bicuspidata NRRL YB-4993 TaxID=869754 RepID=A0A1A0H6R5_9ASCO|nr:multidrug resistance [Metschnikowia bicuspidata var. bicuspidata NRRL YB-4993]OBA19602.1 multidrug resistance [Metschnikowia bicuspidata var. bicuspidata NRRL YB-4993]
MFLQVLRDSFWGNIIYLVSGKRVLRYREEPYADLLQEKNMLEAKLNSKYIAETFDEVDIPDQQLSTDSSVSTIPSDANILAQDSQILIQWEGDDDPDNPYKWPVWYKVIFVTQITLLTSSIYMAGAIYMPSVEQLMVHMNTTRLKASLPLTCFTFGYGVGPMVFSPLSENARFGRTSIYIVSLFLFFVFQIPCALATDITTLSTLRFFAGFFASPALATGGASIGDIVTTPYMPMALACWAAGAFSAPSLGPFIGAALITRGGYHWPYWFITIVSGSILLFYGFFLPESYGKTILYRKASRLRSITDNSNITSEGHLDNELHSIKDVIMYAVWRPLEIVMFEPVVLLMDIYMGFIYAIMYMWFEAFPIVFELMNGFSTLGIGASSLCLTTGLVISVCFHLPVIYFKTTRKLVKGENVEPEVYLPMCIFGSCFMPIGMLIFAWTATPTLHWIIPMIGAATFLFGAFIVYQTLSNYIGMSFPSVLASVYAGNGFCRSMMGGASPLYGRAMFTNLGTKNYPVAWGTTLLACITSALVLVPVYFYIRGPKLRADSKYSG